MQEISVKHLKGESKIARLKIKPQQSEKTLRKPSWIRIKYNQSGKVQSLKKTLRAQQLHTVCEEAQCPNLNECFGKGTATFMIMGQICTRRCPFCDVAHGKPNPLDENEPKHLAQTIAKMALNYVVITSVDRDDLRDGGASHFKACIDNVRQYNPNIQIEILTPDFRGRMATALAILNTSPPDVFNHNLESVPALYPSVRPGADYAHSLNLLKQYKAQQTNVLSKSGLMLGLGEKKQQVIDVMADMRKHNVDMLTLGQYLQPSKHHLPVTRYLDLQEFEDYANIGKKMGFKHVASGPMVRSSYHADQQAGAVDIKIT